MKKLEKQNAIRQKKSDDRALTVILMICICFVVCAIFTSCGMLSPDPDNTEGREAAYTLVPDDEMPAELKKILEKRKEKAFKTTFRDGEDLYIAIGYGKQQTGGYSIQILGIHETQKELVVTTQFLGPSKEETVTQMVSCPYVVVKTGYVEKPVIFQ